MRFEVYADTAEQYRWRLWSGSNRVAVSGQDFAGKSNAERAATSFKGSAKTARYEVFGSGEKWYWNASVSSDKVASGGESFVSQSNAQGAADNVRDNAGNATGP
jgi:uncharacterized protein